MICNKMPNFNSRIISIQMPNECIDVNGIFKQYKYARQEHCPIKLSNGMWLHTYRITEYEYEDPHGDNDIENDWYNDTQII